MKKVFTMTLSIIVIFTIFSGCFKNDENVDKIEIGVIQLVEHESLNLLYKGVVDELEQKGFKNGENIIIDYNNAQGSQVNITNIADKLVNGRSDLIVAIATQAAQAVANKTKSIPIILTSITDPVGAKLVESIQKPNTNVTGTSDLISIEKQVSVIKKTLPNVKNVGILYSSSESNSSFQAVKVKEELSKIGVKGIDFTITNTNDIALVTKAMVGKVDAVYIPNDNMVVSAISTVLDTFNKAHIPVYTSDADSVKKGALASYGVEYYELGKQTGSMIADILTNKLNVRDIPIQFPDKVELVINKKTADMLGIKITPELEKEAKFID